MASFNPEKGKCFNFFTTLVSKALNSNNPDLIRLAHRLVCHPLFKFKPRLNRPQLLDNQTSFFEDRFDGIACCLAGNGAGKSFVGSAKVATFLEETPPPEP